MLEGSMLWTGSAVQWLRDGLKIIKQSGRQKHDAKTCEGNQGVYFVPAFVGLWTPYSEKMPRALSSG